MKRCSVPLIEGSKHLKTNGDEVETTGISTFCTGIRRCICCAFNRNKNLILIYWPNTEIGFPLIFGKCHITIFTLEGYFVTTKSIPHIEPSIVQDTVRFTDDMIIICGGMSRPIILTDLSPKLPLSQPVRYFVDFDEKGDIYTIGCEKNEIVVYQQNSEFKRRFKVDLPQHLSISSLVIRDNAMVILAQNNSFNSPYEIYRYVLSTRTHVECMNLPKDCHLISSYISIDRFKNIFANTNNGICIWPYKGIVKLIKLEDGEKYDHFLITEDSQIILFTRHGIVKVHQLIL